MTTRCYGWKRQPFDPRDRVHLPRFAARQLPPMVSLIDLFPQPLDQGQTNECGPNSLSALIQVDMKVQGASVVPPSRHFLYWCARYEMGTLPADDGVENRSMLVGAHQFGFCPERLWPFDDIHRNEEPETVCFDTAIRYAIEDYAVVPQQLAMMCATLAAGRPFLFGFEVFKEFESEAVAKTGVVPMPRQGQSPIGGHDVCIYGYDLKRAVFLCRNSWGPMWGLKGNFTIPFGYALNPGLAGDFWVVRSVPVEHEPAPARMPRLAGHSVSLLLAA